MNKQISIDLTDTRTTGQLHELLKETFGFPDFYGRNFAALIDCWSSLRYPDDGMSAFTLDSPADCLHLHVTNLASRPEDVIRLLISAVEFVNQRALWNAQKPVIDLVLSESRQRPHL
ncbi:barstar family protein [Mycobacteroides sp. LB1]|uniref:barstar family protein n=1 Tax=Mycobacteroides sp. LB1 TaxID=2750814 RepID=UPI001C5DB69E